MRRALAILALAAALGACTPQAMKGVDQTRLENAIGAAIGDPATCVLLADGKTGKVVYRYGDEFNCARTLPECDAAGVMNAKAALQFASRPGGRTASCPSNPAGTRTVGWAEGRVQSKTRDLTYSAVMEGQNALPGSWMASRLQTAFERAGL